MAYRDRACHEIALMLRTNPKQARVKILAALRAEEGRIAPAAVRLDVSAATLKRWITALDRQSLSLRDELDELRRKRGVPAEHVERWRDRAAT